jgi:hypothetical protein
MLDTELGSEVIEEATHLVKAIFPDDNLPFIVNKNLLDSLTTLYSDGKWAKTIVHKELWLA